MTQLALATLAFLATHFVASTPSAAIESVMLSADLNWS